MKVSSLINIITLVIGYSSLTTSYSTSSSYGSTYVDDGSGKPQGEAWGNAYGSSSVTDPNGYTYKNDGGNNYYTPLNNNQIGQLYQSNQNGLQEAIKRIRVLRPPIVVYPQPPVPPVY